MAKTVRRRYVLATGGKEPEIDRLGVMLACLSECETSDERARLISYLAAKHADILRKETPVYNAQPTGTGLPARASDSREET